MEHTLNTVYEDMQELDRKSEAIVEENIFTKWEGTLLYTLVPGVQESYSFLQEWSKLGIYGK